jgi:riboflavin synthase
VFTGLVQTTGTLTQLRPGPQRQRLVVQGRLDARDLEIGASVAVSGVCLTVVAAAGECFELDAAFETLRCTTLGDKSVGDRVNLEPSLRVGDPLGGHLVSGHVDAVGSLRAAKDKGEARELWFDLPAPLRRFIARKGSVTVDGVSLTVNDVDETGFMVGIIPHTLAVTTLGDLVVGGAVNLEVDVLARYVARLLETGTPAASVGVTMQQLQGGGFLRSPEGGQER